jgi:hypothetical protein
MLNRQKRCDLSLLQIFLLLGLRSDLRLRPRIATLIDYELT